MPLRGGVSGKNHAQLILFPDHEPQFFGFDKCRGGAGKIQDNIFMNRIIEIESDRRQGVFGLGEFHGIDPFVHVFVGQVAEAIVADEDFIQPLEFMAEEDIRICFARLVIVPKRLAQGDAIPNEEDCSEAQEDLLPQRQGGGAC